MIDSIKPKSDFSKNVLTLMTGTGFAQIIPIIASPILTRLYTPEDFGILAMFVAIISILGTVSTGKYELAIVIPEKDNEAFNILSLGIILTFIISLIILVIVVVGSYFISPEIKKQIGIWLYLSPVAVFFVGLFNMLRYYNLRKKYYKDIATATASKSIIAVFSQIVIGFLKEGPIGLLLGQFFSYAISNTRLIKNLSYEKTLINNIKREDLLKVAKKYSKFPKYEMWSQLSNIISGQTPILLLGAFFTNAIVGFYALSVRMLTLPISLIGSSIGQVFLQEVSEIKEDSKKINFLTKQTFKKLFVIGVLPISIIGIYGDLIFDLIFGKNWKVAGEYTRILSLWIFFVFLVSPLQTLMIALEKQVQSFIFNSSILCARVISLFIGYYIFNDAYHSILLYSLVSTVFWFGLMLYIFKLSNIYFKDVYMLFLQGIVIVIIIFFSRKLLIGV
jgi:O-antigen/teichoic acid export membrane protein